jgi:hypothetical protein
LSEEIRDSTLNSGYQQQHSRKALLSFFGETYQGKFVLDIIVRISVTTLLSYPGEKDLQVQVMGILWFDIFVVWHLCLFYIP